MFRSVWVRELGTRANIIAHIYLFIIAHIYLFQKCKGRI